MWDLFKTLFGDVTVPPSDSGQNSLLIGRWFGATVAPAEFMTNCVPATFHIFRTSDPFSLLLLGAKQNFCISVRELQNSIVMFFSSNSV